MQDYLHLHIEDTSTTWHALFGAVEAMKSSFPEVIEDYSVSETTLEQVFLAFARRYNRRPSQASSADLLDAPRASKWAKLQFW